MQNRKLCGRQNPDWLKDEDCRVIAHVGGRDADLNYARDIESSTPLSCIRLGARLADAFAKIFPSASCATATIRKAGRERRPGAS